MKHLQREQKKIGAGHRTFLAPELETVMDRDVLVFVEESVKKALYTIVCVTASTMQPANVYTMWFMASPPVRPPGVHVFVLYILVSESLGHAFPALLWTVIQKQTLCRR
jgi:hypothetical protein